MIIKRSIALFLVLFSCIYFFITNNSNTEQVTEIQVAPSLKLEIGNSECKPSITHAEEITEKETLTENQKHENILNVYAMNISDSKNVFKFQSKNNIERRFYASVNGGKVYSDNSEVFVKGIKAIVEKAINLINNKLGDNAASIFMDMLGVKELARNALGIRNFNDKINIDFRWLGSASLGYYAAENGRIDFEAMYSRLNIIDNNFKPTLDESAGIFAFLLNFYYNPRIKDTQFAPYISLGIGPTIFRLKTINKKELLPLNVPWFAYQVKLGVDYSITPEVKTFLGYRYFNIPLPIADHAATHNIEVGLLFNF